MPALPADQLDLAIANGAKTNFDFNSIPGIATSYWKGLDEASKNKQRDAFKEGIPTVNGQADYGAMMQTLAKAGAPVDQLTALGTAAINQQRLLAGPKAAEEDFPTQGRPATDNLPPSSSRQPSTRVAPALPQGGQPQAPGGLQGQPSPLASPQGQRPPANAANSLVSIIGANGIPDELAGGVITSLSRQLGVDPNAPLDKDDPQVRNVLVPALRLAKRQLGIPDGQPGQLPQQGGQQQPAQAYAQSPQAGMQRQPIQPGQMAPPQGNAGPQPDAQSVGGITDPTMGGLVPQGRTGGQQINLLTKRIMSGQLTADETKVYQDRIKGIQDYMLKAGEPTNDQKDYLNNRQQGETLPAYQARVAGGKAFAEDEAKRNGKKYDSLIEAGTKASIEIPQLQLIQNQMQTDPNFYSGFGAKYNLLWKQMTAGVANAFPSLGLDPNAAFSQEAFGKVMAGNVLNSLGQLKGMGQIRVAEINLAKDAAASQNYSKPANQVLVEISKRLHERAGAISDMASSYNGGRLDAGFDRDVSAYDKDHPLFDENEIKDWRKIIGQTSPKPPERSARPSSAATPPRFNSPADFQAARLPKGSRFVDPNGVTRTVP